ncbi:MAG: SH3 domain-containing protein [Deltaproteobacteria bacterium]|nr:SH3 domain-containing protein [Deltaproteobacteria bacterium]
MSIFGLIAVILFLTVFSNNASSYDITISPSFWISQLDDPDSVLMNDEEINNFNDAIISSIDQMANIRAIGATISGDRIKEYLLHDPLPTDKIMFDKNDRRISKRFYRDLEKNINLEDVKDAVPIKFGVIIKKADIRGFPTIEPILEYPKSLDFDTVQYSTISPPEPAALLHLSKDKKWGFFQTSFVRGWIRLDKVAFAKDAAHITSMGSRFLVITGSYVHVYKDREFKKPLEKLPMGSRLSIINEDKDRWSVSFPYRDENGILKWGNAYVNKTSDVHREFLPYSKKNIISQAFKILGQGYGWGGINNKRDCSSFIKDVFATVGINLPRNSRQQITVGKALGNIDNGNSRDDLKALLNSAIPGITLLGLNGHIMLYLGSIEDRRYAIHSLFRYGGKVVNKNVVTDLNLGNGAKNKAFIDRLKGITIISSANPH